MKEKFKKGIYIVPSLITCGNMTFGILSIFSSIGNDFITASWCLVAALVCDILDGRIARMTKTTSEFGMQLDSLSDLVSFGIAPALMMYLMVLKTMDKIGIAIAVLFVLCSALRLARFNVKAHQSTQSGKTSKYFIGLPTPASAGLLISFVLSYELLDPEGNVFNSKTIPDLMNLMPFFYNMVPIALVVLSFLMVSNIPYTSFKKLKLTKVRTIELLTLLIVLIILIIVFPQNVIFLIFSFYVLSGIIFYIPRLLVNRRRQKKQEQEQLDTEQQKQENNDITT